METKKILKYTGLGIILVILIAAISMSFIIFDVMSYTATGSEKLNFQGEEVGKALVVYDPGISGASKDTALAISKELQKKGYIVELAGISSAAAKNTTGYDIIIVGGPIYAGNASSSVQNYLKTLNIDVGTKIGVFANGQDQDVINNQTLLVKEVAPLPQNSTLKITAVTKIIKVNEANQKIVDFINALIT